MSFSLLFYQSQLHKFMTLLFKAYVKTGLTSVNTKMKALNTSFLK